MQPIQIERGNIETVRTEVHSMRHAEGFKPVEVFTIATGAHKGAFIAVVSFNPEENEWCACNMEGSDAFISANYERVLTWCVGLAYRFVCRWEEYPKH